MQTGKQSGIVIAVVLALVYFLAARLSLHLAFAGSNASPIWPPTGIAIAALCFWGVRLAPAVTLAAFAANLLAFQSTNPDLPLHFWIVSAVIALGNTAEAFVGALYLRRDPEFPKLLESQRSVLRFVLIALLASAISASIGTSSLVAANIIPDTLQTTVGLTWWIGDLCGALIFVPFVAAWARGCRAAKSSTPFATAAQFSAALVLAALVAWLVFGHWIVDPALSRPLVFLIFPVLGWIAWQFGLRGAGSGLIVIAIIAVIGTTRGSGPFATGNLNESLILLDSFLALIAATALLLSADRLERLREGFANTLREYAPPGLVLLGSIGVTVLVWHLLTLESEHRGERRFALIVREVASQIEGRMHDYQRALRGGSGLFAVSPSVERGDWKAYSETLQLQETLPGVQGLGFILRIPAGQQDALSRKIRAEGFPDFAIKPAGKRDEYGVIIYLEPFDRRNQRAFGYDLMSEPMRRAAMVHARDTGQTTLSGKVTLVQEDGQDSQSGFLMFEPVYRRGLSVKTVEARRQALLGYVYSPFRAHDLMRGILGERWPEVWLEVFDGEGSNPGQQLYASPEMSKLSATQSSRYVQEKTLVMFGHAWTLRLHSSAVFEAEIDRQKSQFVFVAGGIVSLLLFAMMRLQSLTGARAMKLAQGITLDLQHAQIEVQQREQFSRAVFEAAPEALLLVDADGRIAQVNQTALTTFGFSLEEILGMAVEALIPERFRVGHAALRNGFDRSAGQRSMGKNRELYALRADGREIPVEVALAPLAFGAERFVVVSLLDISQRKAAEAEMRVMTSLRAAILDSAAVSIISTDVAGTITSFNYGAENLLGYRAEEVVGKTSPAIIHSPDEVVARAAEFSAELGITLEPGFEVFVVKSRKNLPNTYEWTYVAKDGKRLPVLLSVTALRDSNDEITGFLGVAVDISERKAAQEALEEKERLLRTIADNIPGMVGYWDFNLQCRFANRAYLEWFGKTPEQLIGINMKNLLTESVFEKNLPYIQGALNGKSQHFERTLTKPDGSLGHTFAHYIPDIDGDVVRGFVVLVTDVTPLKQAQLDLEVTNLALSARTREAEAASRAKSDFVANMSHEIRTPMNAVIGLSQLMQDTELDETQRDYLGRIQTASKALLGIINDILDYSKIEAGHMELESADFSLESVLKSISDLFATAASTKHIELFYEIDPTVPLYLKGDALRLGQVLHNLVGNAVKFTAQGEIHVKFAAEPANDDRLHLCVSVRDTGIGMTPEQAVRLFQPFEQADTSITRKYGGTGLGLSISKRLVELMGGNISVVSEEGKGSSFNFTVNVGIGESQHHERALGDISRLRTLVVDDQETSLMIMQHILNTWGCEINMASDGVQALALMRDAALENRPFELLLLDWQMPEMDGLELARKIDELVKAGTLPKTPKIIMVTAFGRDQLAQLKGETHVDGILEKPVLPSQLYDAIADIQGDANVRRVTPVARGGHWSAITQPVSGAKILLVEDNATNQLVAQEFLRAMGMRVELANDGREAVDKVAERDYDLILMDLQMPVMDGFEATRAIRATEKGKNLPIVAMTAAAMIKDKHATEAAGMSAHISKPIEPEILAKTLLHYLPQRKTVTLNPNGMSLDNNVAAFELPGLDLQSAVRRMDNNWDLLRKVCLSFAKDFADAPSRLTKKLNAGDFAAAARLAHTVKGLSMNVGATTLHEVAAKFEDELKNGEASQREAFELALADTLSAISVLDEPAGAAQGQVELSVPVDKDLVMPRLRELEIMLVKKQGKARKFAKEIQAMLKATALESSFQNVIVCSERLQFDAALDALKELMHQHFDPSL